MLRRHLRGEYTSRTQMREQAGKECRVIVQPVQSGI